MNFHGKVAAAYEVDADAVTTIAKVMRYLSKLPLEDWLHHDF